MDRITLVHKSMAAFICGLVGLLPFLGCPFGIAALVMFVRVRYRTEDWNPAERYLNWAARFALIGFVFSLLVFAMIFLAIVNQSNRSDWNGSYLGLE